MSTGDLTSDKNDFIECYKHEKIDKLENFHNLSGDRFHAIPHESLPRSLFILSLLCLLFVYQSPLCLRYIALQFQGSLNFTGNWNIHIRETFETRDSSTKIRQEVRAPSNTVDHAHTRVRSYEIKANAYATPVYNHGYTCRSDLHIISKSVNTGHGSDFHSRMALSRIRCLCRYHMRGSWLEETVNENGTERGDSIPSLNLWEMPEKDAAFYEAVGWHK